MTVVLQADPATYKVAIFDEAVGGGDPASPTSARNRPLLDPANWLANIYFHSDLDNMEVHSDTTVPVSHPAVGGVTTGGMDGGGNNISGGETQNAANLRYRRSTADYALVNHNLGYIPDAFAVVGSQALFPGMPVQTQGDGRGRYCTVYLTSTQVRLFEWSSVSASDLPALTLSYRVIVLARPRDPSGAILFDYDPASGRVTMARGRFDSTRNYLQVVPGGSPFGIPYGKTIDLKNGAPRFVRPDGTIFEPVPSTLKGKFVVSYTEDRTVKTYNPGYKNSMAYNGAFTGPQQILVQAP